MTARADRIPTIALAALALTAAPAAAQSGNYGMVSPDRPDEVQEFSEDEVGLTPPPPGERQIDTGLTFRDAKDNPVTLGDCIGGKPTVMILAYYRCPQICSVVLTTLMDKLRGLQRYDVGKDFNVIVVSFDPKEKPPIAYRMKQEILKGYGRRGAGSAWFFLTGGKPNVDKLCESVGFNYKYDKRTKRYFHSAGLMVLTPGGEVARYITAQEDYKPKDIRFALQEAGKGVIEETTVDWLWRCAHYYNATEGKYQRYSFVMNILAGLAALTVVGLFVGLYYLFRSKPKPPADWTADEIAEFEKDKGA